MFWDLINWENRKMFIFLTWDVPLFAGFAWF